MNIKGFRRMLLGAQVLLYASTAFSILCLDSPSSFKSCHTFASSLDNLCWAVVGKMAFQTLPS